MKTTRQIHAKINLRVALQDALNNNGVVQYGGPNNATVKQSWWPIMTALKVNYLVNGLDQFRKR